MANSKPVAEVRIGRVKAAVWPNETEGRTRHNVTFSRLPKRRITSAQASSASCGRFNSLRAPPLFTRAVATESSRAGFSLSP